MSRTPIILLAPMALAACAHTDPGPGADIAYRLPRTDVTADLALTLKSCTADQLSIEGTAAITAKAGAQDQLIRVTAADLASARVERDLVISTGDDLVLIGVNAQATDQTGAIIANVAKLALTLAAPAAAAPAAHAPGAPGRPPSLCTDTIVDALARVDALDARILSLRDQLSRTAAPGDVRDVRELNARIKERADLKANLLQVTASAPMKLPHGPDPAASWSGSLIFQPDDFRKWLGPNATADRLATMFPVTWTATRRAAPSAVPPTGLRSCGKALPVPVATDVEFKVEGPDPSTDRTGLAGIAATEVFPVAQINRPSDLCIDVGFGETRTIEVAFDSFGRTTKLHWASAATAANVSGALAGAAPDVKSLLAKSPQPSVIDQQKAEIDRLKTLQEYNALRACAAVLEAGGSDCSPAPD